MVNLLILSPIPVMPTNQGAARRIVDIGKTLARAGLKVTILELTINSFFKNSRPKFIWSENNFQIVNSGFFRTTVLKYLLSSKVIQFEFPFLFFIMIILKLIGRPYILDEHDVEFSISLILNKKVFKNKDGNNFSLLNLILQQTPYVTLIIEKISLSLATLIFACSELDSKLLSKLYKIKKNKIVVIPNSVQAHLYKNVAKKGFSFPSVIFVGSFKHLPNVYAAKMIIEEIAPLVIERYPEVVFVIVGSSPPSFLINKNEKGIQVVGEVEDVRPYIAGATVAIAPIYQGSGTRIKILEYMHLGKPIVSTRKGAEGLEVIDGMHLLLRDNPSDFSDAIIRLLTDKVFANKISEKAKKFAVDKYSWETNSKIILANYRKLWIKHLS